MSEAENPNVPEKSPITRRLLVGAAVGLVAAGVVAAAAGGAAYALAGKNEGESGLFGALVWVILVPLGIITLAPLWLDHVHLYYVACPWYLALRHLLPETPAIVVGFMLNGAIVGALVACIDKTKQVLPIR